VGNAGQIKNVYMDDRSSNGDTDISLDIHLTNGQIIIYSLNDRIDDPRFSDILSGNYKEDTFTDGENIYWSNGVSISLDEVFDSLISTSTRLKLANRWRTAAISIGLVAVMFIFAILSFSPVLFPGNDEAQFEDTMIPLDAAPDIEPDLYFPGEKSVTIPAGSTDMEIFLINPEYSDNYVAFEIMMDGKLLAASEMIPPGDQIGNLRLEEPLAKGEYEASLFVIAYDAIHRLETGFISIVITLSVN